MQCSNICTRHAAADNYRDIHFFLLGLHNNKRSELIPFCHSQSYSNKVLALALFYITEYRGFSAYANFISAYFITAIFQNISEIFGERIFGLMIALGGKTYVVNLTIAT